MNKVKVAWNRPICQGGARVREYKVGDTGGEGGVGRMFEEGETNQFSLSRPCQGMVSWRV